MTLGGLTELAERLRAHAEAIKNLAAKATMGADMTSAAVVIDQLLGLYADIHAANESEIVKRIGDLVAGPGKARIVLVMPHAEMMALAQFLKRLGFEDCTRYAAPSMTYGDRPEADIIWSGVLTLQRGLAEAGHAPR